jgi:hypothetical protein
MLKKAKNKPVSFKWHNRRKTLITLRWKRGIPRLVIHEKYENLVKWLLRTLAFIGILTSVLYIPFWYLSLLSALLLVAIEQFLERAVFLYTIFYWQPMPYFKWDIGDEWEAMGFAFPESKSPKALNLVGPVFKSESCTREFFNLLRKWNYNSNDDKENNICLSLITVKDGYYAFIYPNLKRQTIKSTFNDIEESARLKKYGKESQQFVVQFIFCKHFIYGHNSMFERFAQEQASGRPYWLQAFLQNSDGLSSILYDEKPILKHHVKIRKREELEKSEVEYQHFKNVIDTKQK